MDFELTPDQEELRSSVRAVLGKECPPDTVRAIVEGRASPDALWEAVAPLGWPALTVPEEDGGLGFGAVEAALVAVELGRVAAPGPLLQTVTQLVPALRAAGDHDRLRAVAAGGLTGALVHDGFALDGDRVDILVVADDDGLSIVDAAAVTTTTVEPYDPSRSLVRVEVPDGAGEPVADRSASDRTVDEATVGLAAETIGACQTAFEMTLSYAKVREQFGVPIGTFQAVKHQLADCTVVLQKAQATVEFAAMTIDEDDPRRHVAASMAKAAAGDCQRTVAARAIQLHGGIGYTWEHDLHLFVKRAKANDAVLGTGAGHRRRLGAELIRSGPGG